MSDPIQRMLGWHLARHLLFWLPIFQLYLSGKVGLTDALWLESLYYIAVFGLEVPTGWISDRLGRRVALVVSPLAWGAGAVAFACADGFWGLALGELGYAFGMATGSGSDTAWLYDHLRDQGRQDEHQTWEAKASARRLIGMAMGAVGGAALGVVDLRLPYLAFAVACGIAAALAYSLPEPPRTHVAPPPREAARQWWQHITTDPVLRWGLGAEIAMLVLVHIPYELYQPWLRLALGTEDLAVTTSGALAAGAALLGAWSTRHVGWLRQRLSAEAVMATSLGVITVICLLLGLSQSSWLLAVVLLRSAPEAVATPALRARLHPRLPSALRATWWSVQSLAGRAAFALTLWAGASWTGGTEGDAVVPLLLGAAGLGTVLTAGVWWTRAPDA